MLALAVPLLHHSGRWWLYLLASALLAAIVGTVVVEATQGISRRLSRVRLWLGGLGAAVFFALLVRQPPAARPASLASFASGMFVCSLLFFGWFGLQRRR
jgi:hypothetical protein